MKNTFKNNKGFITLGITGLVLSTLALGSLIINDTNVNAENEGIKTTQTSKSTKEKSTDDVEREAREYLEKQKQTLVKEKLQKQEKARQEAEAKKAEEARKKAEAEKQAQVELEKQQEEEAQRIANEEAARQEAQAQQEAQAVQEAQDAQAAAPSKQAQQQSAPVQQSIGANMIGINGIFKPYHQLGPIVDTPTFQYAIDQGHIASGLTWFNPGDGQTTYFGGHNPGVMGFMEANMQIGAIVTVTDGNGTAYNYRTTDHVIVDTVGESVFGTLGISGIDLYEYGSGQESIAIQYCQTYGGLMNMWYLIPA